MKTFSSLVKYSFIYTKNYLMEGLAIRFPKIIPKPLYIGLSVGTVCNFRCRHCDLWRINTDPEKYLKSKHIKKILKALKNWLGPFRLVFTGAEPLLRRDLLGILKFCSENEIYTVLNSNGWLIDKEMAKKLVKAGLDVINISLDGADAETHDFLRGKGGVFDQAVEALDFLMAFKKKTPNIYITTVIMEPNVSQLVPLIELTKAKEIDGIRFQALESKYLFGDKPYDSNWFKNEPLWPKNSKKTERILKKIIQLKKNGNPIKNSFWELRDLITYYRDPSRLVKKQKYCYSGVRNFLIDEYGQVKICFGMAPAGDLLKEKPREIWYGSRANKQRQVIAHCSRTCRILLCNRRESLDQIFEVFLKRIKFL